MLLSTVENSHHFSEATPKPQEGCTVREPKETEGTGNRGGTAEAAHDLDICLINALYTALLKVTALLAKHHYHAL